MSYLDKVVKETSRKWPANSFNAIRRANRSYTFKNTNVTIPENMIVFVPVWAIHRDLDIYPDPEVFDPEQFNEVNEKTRNLRNPMHYLPFGAGSRNCIGSCFAIYLTKIRIAAIIEKFQIDVCEKTYKEYLTKPYSAIAVPMDGMFLKFSKA